MLAANVMPRRLMTSHVPLLLAIVILASTWIYYFTNYFPVFGSLLGLGGVLVVVPVLQGFMSEERRKAWSAFADRILFQSQASAIVYLVLLVVGLAAGFVLTQPLRISVAAGAQPMNLDVALIGANGNVATHRLTLTPNSTFAVPMAQPFFGGTQAVQIVAEGFPQLRRDIGNFDWPSFSLPTVLWTEPVALLHPDPDLLITVDDRRPKLTVARQTPNGDQISCVVAEKYLGEPVWLGGGSERFNVSDGTRSRWIAEFKLHVERNELDQTRTLELLPFLIDQPVRAACIDALAAGDAIAWTLEVAGDRIASGNSKIAANVAYPQEIVLRQQPGE